MYSYNFCSYSYTVIVKYTFLMLTTRYCFKVSFNTGMQKKVEIKVFDSSGI